MTPIVAFISGLFIGWLIEWVIDWFYWRRRIKPYEDAAAECHSKVIDLETELSASQYEVNSLQEKVNTLELEKARLEALSQQTQQELAAARAQVVNIQPTSTDNLEDIKGIGPVIARKLNDGGIHTFEQLAAQTPEYLRTLLGDAVQRLADEESLIAQAAQFAQQKQSKGISGQ
jgi:predicted flap endonuclease-1-like 5' DNA nuclease